MERARLTGNLARLMERAKKEGYKLPETPVPASKADPEKDKLRQADAVSKRGIVEGRGNKGGTRELARQMGRPEVAVRRELKIDGLSAYRARHATADAKVEFRRSKLNQDDSEPHRWFS